VNLGKLLEEFTKDWEWLSFLTRYCAGRNIGKDICEDVKWWALGLAGLLLLIVVWWILSKLQRTYENWSLRRRLAKVANAKTMKEHVWSGYTPEATPSSEQRAQRRPGK
jgi:hypothetical protein